jgi:hypothetical protein
VVSHAAEIAVMEKENKILPFEDEATTKALYETLSDIKASSTSSHDTLDGAKATYVLSFRLALSGFVISLIDSAPSEIAVVVMKNVNALATWSVPRVTDATMYLTVENLQIDNMVPNAPYPVALCADESILEDKDSIVPLLVIGVSFAPRHKSGIVVS